MSDPTEWQGGVGRTTTQIESASPLAEVDVRLPGLTVIYHPDLARVGERTFLSDLGSRPVALARSEPTFAMPGSASRRPLEDSRLSRHPIRLTADPASGNLILNRSATRTTLEVDGKPVADQIEVATEQLETGVVLLLAHQIVLLLHLLDPAPGQPNRPRGLIGESTAMHRLRRDIERVADLVVPVLLLGETGTGKELVARAIHDAGPRSEAPFVAVNMAAIPGPLAATELFGARKGAFTGADRSRKGHFLRADGGTLFLDEVGETPIDVQTLLLRALESGEVQPVGADSPLRPDVRLISATDSDLDTAIAKGGFRAPVLHRLSGFVIHLPPLRARREDFGRLLVHFLRAEAEAVGELGHLEVGQLWLPAALAARLALWHWPGNIRQLRNTVRQLVIAHRGLDRIMMTPAVETMLRKTAPGNRVEPASQAPPTVQRIRAKDIGEDDLVTALEKHEWVLQATADYLGISRPALYHRIKKSPRLLTAADLGAQEISNALEANSGDTGAAARRLCVSARALRRRMTQLGIKEDPD